MGSALDGLSRTGSSSLVYAGDQLGIALMFAGFAFVGKRPKRRPQPRVAYERKVTAA